MGQEGVDSLTQQCSIICELFVRPNYDIPLIYIFLIKNFPDQALTIQGFAFLDYVHIQSIIKK